MESKQTGKWHCSIIFILRFVLLFQPRQFDNCSVNIKFILQSLVLIEILCDILPFGGTFSMFKSGNDHYWEIKTP